MYKWIKMSNFQVFVEIWHILEYAAAEKSNSKWYFRGRREKKRLLHGYYRGMQFGNLAVNEHANASALILPLWSKRKKKVIKWEMWHGEMFHVGLEIWLEPPVYICELFQHHPLIL